MECEEVRRSDEWGMKVGELRTKKVYAAEVRKRGKQKCGNVITGSMLRRSEASDVIGSLRCEGLESRKRDCKY